jgi:hypothetical protein
MAVRTVNKDGSVTVTTEDEDGGPTGAVEYPGEPVTTTFEPAVAESKVVAKSESKTVAKKSSK